MVNSSSGHQVLPPKARKALQASGIRPLPEIILRRRLPAGRGYGTSTADIGSVLFAAARFGGSSLDGFTASQIAAGVEPTDSSLLPGLALFDHREAAFYELLGEPPKISLIILDSGGTVDSQAFNLHDWSAALEKLKPIHQEALGLLRQGVKESNIELIGQASTLSAVTHQGILYSPWLETALTLANKTGAAGICRAHSGTILAIIYPSSSFDRISLLSFIRNHIPHGLRLRTAQMVSGGFWDGSKIPKESFKSEC
ncbi:MAG: hypothetical protein VB108_10800 [Anaerolineaceae bacterium]|nr:hypothetical protein [Anaerolineaceae bacterium]